MAQEPASLRLAPLFLATTLFQFGIGWWLQAPAGVMVILVAGPLVAWVMTWILVRGAVERLAHAVRQTEDGVKHPLDDRGGAFAPIPLAVNALAREFNEQLGHMQTQLNEREAVLRSMTSGLLALDRDQHVLSLNRAAERLLGLDAAQARGRLVQEVLRQPGLNRFVAEAIASRTHTSDEFALEGSDPVIIQAASEPLHDADDKPVGLLILLNDVTQIRRLETLRSDFAANVSHELRTPITNIKGYVETLQEVGVEDEAQTAKFLEVIRTNADRLASIIEDLLALSRLEQPEARESLNPVVVGAAKLAHSVLEQLRPAADAKRIALRFAGDEQALVRVNPQLVEQAIANLVSNAVKYCNPGTPVEVRVGCLGGADAGMVEIAVRDEGPGIAPQHLSRIFERFYRVDKARSRDLGGTGLGLAIVKHIALVHGGRVEVESRVGRGSTFRLLLPEAPTDPA
jgi:two-component system, OmpR family, phosphate regulon sensor histidine kinase PhoR